MSSDLYKNIRKFVFDYFVEYSRAPHVEEIMGRFKISKQEVFDAQDSLEKARLLYRLKGTQRILMAHPFSNMPTPFLVRTENGKRYYANCAWDSIALHFVLSQPVQVESYCFHCNDPVQLGLKNERLVEKKPEDVLIHFSKPLAQWWDDVVDTCGNNMNFFSSEQHLKEWKAMNPSKHGYTLTFDQVIAMSRFHYRDRFNIDYRRHTNDELAAFFASIGLTGDFWRI